MWNMKKIDGVWHVYKGKEVVFTHELFSVAVAYILGNERVLEVVNIAKLNEEEKVIH